MALTRKFLKGLGGVEDEAIEDIIKEHRGTVDSLRDELDNLKEEIAKSKDIEKELNELKDKQSKGDSYKEKYEKLESEFKEYKTSVDGEKLTAKKSEAYKKALKEAGVSDKRIESVLRLAKADGEIDKIEFDGDEVKGIDKITEKIKSDYADYIETESTSGAKTPNPPSSKGGSKMTKEQIYAKDDKGRYVLSTEERHKAIAENMVEFS